MEEQTNYRSISCDAYSEYEVAILHRNRLHLRWQDENGDERDDEVVPTDLRTEEQAEYLYAEAADGDPQRIRLDRIREAQVIEK